MSCPADDTWLLLELGELTVNARDAALDHAGGCASCQRVHAAQRLLLSDLSAPAPSETSTDRFVAEVLAACEASPAATLPAVRGAGTFAPWLFGALAAAAAILLLFVPRGSEEKDRVQARGRSSSPSTSQAQPSADVFVAHGSTLESVGGVVLGPGDRLAVRVANPTARARFFMAFAIDSAGEVHWLYPAYDEPGQDPLAPELPAYERAHVLPETVELDAPAAGKLRIVSMLSGRRMSVREVERHLGTEPHVPLARAFPEVSTLHEWSCMWRAR